MGQSINTAEYYIQYNNEATSMYDRKKNLVQKINSYDIYIYIYIYIYNKRRE